VVNDSFWVMRVLSDRTRLSVALPAFLPVETMLLPAS
jgi:hypothetical protein